MTKAMLLVAVLGAGSALADEKVYQFRSVEDPANPPDLAVCAAAPFRVNVLLGASLWAFETRGRDGKVVEAASRKVGTATACIRLTNFLFPPGLQQEFYVVFSLPSGKYTASGTCTLTSNDVPAAGLVLAGCALKVLSAPAGVAGGVATSASVFNPFRLPGYSTGSYWTLQTYDNGTVGNGEDHSAHAHDLEDVEDSRTDDEIAAQVHP